MPFVRKLLYHLAGNSFRLLLLLLPVLFAMSLVFGTPNALRKAASQSNLYKTLITSATEDGKERVTQDSTADQLLADPTARQAISSSFSPQLLEQSANSVIDGTYGWLQGKTAEPEFTIDLTAAKNDLTKNLTNYAANRAAGLPVCTLEQLRTIDPQVANLLSLPCRPPGIDPQQLGQQFAQQATEDVLRNAVITSDTIAKQNNGKTIGQTLSAAPKLYRAVEVGKWVLLGLATALALVLVLARTDRLAGLKYVGKTLLITGLLLALVLVVYWFAVGRVSNVTQGPAVEAAWLKFGKILIGDINKVIGVFAGIYAAIGTAILLSPRFLDRKPATTEPPAADPPTPPPMATPQSPIIQ